MKLVLVVVCKVNIVIGILQWWNKTKGLNMDIGKTNKVGMDFYRNRPFVLFGILREEVQSYISRRACISERDLTQFIKQEPCLQKGRDQVVTNLTTIPVCFQALC